MRQLSSSPTRSRVWSSFITCPRARPAPPTRCSRRFTRSTRWSTSCSVDYLAAAKVLDRLLTWRASVVAEVKR
jgi:hypothetical protein